MKSFKDPKAMYLKIVDMQDEIKNILQEYIDEENIGVDDFEEKLYNRYNEVAEHIFDKLNSQSKNLDYLKENMENEDGDAHIVTAFIRAYVTDRILFDVVSFEFEREASHV